MENVLDILEKTAEKLPEKVVFKDESEEVTYKEFVIRAKQMGTFIYKKFQCNSAVPIYMDKSIDSLVTMFGAIYAGCFYSIIDIHHPIARVNQILDTLQTNKVITISKNCAVLQKIGFTGETIVLEDVMNKDSAIDEDALKQIRKEHLGKDPLYCNFTSGSTGIPKGVLVGHVSVIDFITHFTEMFGITEDDVIGNQAPFDFDVSVKDIYSTIFTGATMVIIPKKNFSFPTKLLDCLCDNNITTLIWAVSALCIVSTLKGFTYRVPDKINKVIFSGEVMPIKQLNVWREYIKDAKYVNVYGPTEITCNCTYYEVPKDRHWDESEKLPIGSAFPNEKVFLLDVEDHSKCIQDKDVIGEICVSGECLALGYYNNPEQTAKAFIQNPVNKNYLEIIYCTGDLGSYNESGELCYKGRKDFQIKHMGHRIELEEIESAINEVEQIQRVCCIFDTESNNIVGFYCGDIEKKDLKKELRKTLPAFMIPTKFMQLETFPLTKNGKTDRKQLLEAFRNEEKRV